MFNSILVPIDLADTDLAKPAIAMAATLSQTWGSTVRLLNVLPMTPVMLAEYVPADFDTQQRQISEEALVIVARESGIDAARIEPGVIDHRRLEGFGGEADVGDEFCFSVDHLLARGPLRSQTSKKTVSRSPPRTMSNV